MPAPQCATATDVDEPDAWQVLSSWLSGCKAAGPPPVVASAGDLLARFAQIPDPRCLQWVDHPLPAVLALCAGAV